MTKGKDPSETIADFKGCVNMDAKELEKWLRTSESNMVPPKAFHLQLLTPLLALTGHCSSVPMFFEGTMPSGPTCSLNAFQVGWAPDGGESTGHDSGRIIVVLLQKKGDEYDEDDIHQMSRVISYVHRHRAQGPSKHSIETSKWRYSLMNWWAN
ncbi:g2400 [Coccomyxa viridis]|uniref:G2400 protein n=1 Tax=Coccomyxa viridis TaxID=1274662 RepID=A0ABP1FQI4_9CHLO